MVVQRRVLIVIRNRRNCIAPDEVARAAGDNVNLLFASVE